MENIALIIAAYVIPAMVTYGYMTVFSESKTWSDGPLAGYVSVFWFVFIPGFIIGWLSSWIAKRIYVIIHRDFRIDEVGDIALKERPSSGEILKMLERKGG